MDDSSLEKWQELLCKIGNPHDSGYCDKDHQCRRCQYRREEKPADSLKKNEIALCQITLSDRIVADEFKKHKTLGELILIDRVTNMTSACGVVESVEEQEEGLGNKPVDSGAPCSPLWTEPDHSRCLFLEEKRCDTGSRT